MMPPEDGLTPMAQIEHTQRTFRMRVADRMRHRLLIHELLNRIYAVTGFHLYAYTVFRDRWRGEAPRSIDGVEFRPLSASDAASLAALTIQDPAAQAALAASLVARFEGSVGFGAFIAGEPVGYCWADREKCRVPVADSALLALERDEAAAYDLYVIPKLRGRRIGTALREAFYARLAEDGRPYTYRAVSVLNTAARRIALRSGAEELETRVLVGFPKVLAMDFRLSQRADAVRTKRLSFIARARRGV